MPHIPDHSSLEAFRSMRDAKTRRVPERSDARRDNSRKAPPPPRPTDKSRGKHAK